MEELQVMPQYELFNPYGPYPFINRDGVEQKEKDILYLSRDIDPFDTYSW